jgi:5-methylcytosine-specific restriction endonuclease McrA
VIPSSQAPELFWAEENLRAACTRCNYGDGAHVAHENTRQTIEKLRVLVWDRQVEIDWLRDRLARDEEALQGEPDRRSTDLALNA